MFKSIEEIQEKLRKENYICGKEIAITVFLSERMGKPILVEGPAGVGKTELAKVLAEISKKDLIRLQCYEGLDETKALYEWEYAKQLLYTQILKDKIGEDLKNADTLKDAVERISAQDQVFFSEKFVLPRPLLLAITLDRPVVLLIDEIDRSDLEFEAFLLEVLSDFQVSIPELGTLRAKHIPSVVLTSNNTRDMSDALKRRCLHLFIDFPKREHEIEIIKLKVPEIEKNLAEEIVKIVQKIRNLDLKKAPGISETLDWARGLTLLNIESLDEETTNNTLNLILKYEEDIGKVKSEINRYFSRKATV